MNYLLTLVQFLRDAWIRKMTTDVQSANTSNALPDLSPDVEKHHRLGKDSIPQRKALSLENERMRAIYLPPVASLTI